MTLPRARGNRRGAIQAARVRMTGEADTHGRALIRN